ncbi:hypothetical protein RND81_02G004200 [Saponaria officinalis]|uniref:TF-B3 domain-containing protein n=1 Tax=Saponaria officinalis TaxID=3572 RepID=A0AAW1MQ24_SAPOF
MKRRRREDENSITSVDTKPRSFFKLMLSPSSQSIKLRIPEVFASAYEEELCTSTDVVLVVPTGETWKVTITKEDDKLWFREGWRNFVDNYSIDYGYFMLFEYEGNLRFNVHVFDLTTCEISYQCEKEPCQSSLGREQEVPCKREADYTDKEEEEEEEEDDDDDNDDDNDEEEEEEEEDDDDSDGDDDDSDFECLGSPSSSPTSHDESSDHNSDTLVGRRGTSLTRLPVWFGPYKKLMKAVTAGGIPVPKNPFFVADIKAYCLYRSLYLNIPLPFARELLGRKNYCTEYIKLEAADGRHWEVKCIINGSKSMFGRGWIIFARHYGLEVGDVCVFEVISSKPYVLKVQVAKKSLIESTGRKY